MNEEELAKICNKSTSDCIELAKQLKEAQQRINKAMEYMKNIQWFYLKNNEGLQLYATTDNFYNDLSNILKGEDNE